MCCATCRKPCSFLDPPHSMPIASACTSRPYRRVLTEANDSQLRIQRPSQPWPLVPHHPDHLSCSTVHSTRCLCCPRRNVASRNCRSGVSSKDVSRSPLARQLRYAQPGNLIEWDSFAAQCRTSRTRAWTSALFDPRAGPPSQSGKGMPPASPGAIGCVSTYTG